MDYTTFEECRLQNVREKKVYANKEEIGVKTVIDVVTWGERYTVEVNSDYAKELKLNVTGKALVNVSFTMDARVAKFGDDPAYVKQVVKATFENLAGFEPSKG
jgi:hypothetical protein